MARRRRLRPRQRAQALAVGRAGHALLAHDRGDVAAGRHVEGGIAHGHARGGHPPSAVMRHLVRGPLLDGDLGAGGDGEIEGRDGGGDVEGDPVLLGQHRHRVGSDLVGDVAVSGDAVGAHHHQVDLAGGHHVAGHVVRDQRGRDPVLGQLPGGETRALQVRAGLVREHAQHVPVAGGGADHPQRGPVAGGGQRARVAVGEDARRMRDQLRPQVPHAVAGGQVLFEDRVGLGQEPFTHGRSASRLVGGEAPPHALDGPEEVDRGRTRDAHLLADGLEVAPQRLAFRGRAPHSQRDAEGRGHSDGGRAAHGHVADGRRHLGRMAATQVRLFLRQPPLVDQHHRFVVPHDRPDHSWPPKPSS